jgi:aquaporin Z
MLDAFKNHWPDYLIEAWCLGTFMVSACLFGALLFNPRSPLAAFDVNLRNVLMGLAMGSTAIGIIKSSWGQRSGAHFNPAVTLTFLRLQKIEPRKAIFYILFQFAGGAAGVILSWLVLGDLLSASAVNFVVTIPGTQGAAVAFIAEFAISFVLMTTVLFTGSSDRLAKLTPVFVGVLLALYIAVESPVSGTSMNPARTFASSVVADDWTSWWIYFTAPPLAMLAAAEFFLRTRGLRSGRPAKARGIPSCEAGKRHAFGRDLGGDENITRKCVTLTRSYD